MSNREGSDRSQLAKMLKVRNRQRDDELTGSGFCD
jgi:hypothetical protein